MRRFTIDMTEARMGQIQALMREGHAATNKEFINTAITLLEWAMKQVREGRIVASVDEGKDSYKELVMPMLTAVSDKRAKANG